MSKHLLTARSIRLPLNEIGVNSAFRNAYPKPEKLAKTYSAMIEDKAVPTILVDENDTIIDGYTTYLVSKMLGKKKVNAIRITVAQEPAVNEPLENQVEKAMLSAALGKPAGVLPWNSLDDEMRVATFHCDVEDANWCLDSCPLSKYNNGTGEYCLDFCNAHPEAARNRIAEDAARQHIAAYEKVLKVRPEEIKPWDGEDEERLFPFCNSVDCFECDFRKRMHFDPGDCVKASRENPGKARRVLREMEAEQNG